MIESFDFDAGRQINNKYQIVSFLGKGWEGEVYLIEEISTGIERAAKFFYPQRNKDNKVAERFAKKLYRNRDNPSVVQYLNQELIRFKGYQVSCLVSEFVDGEILSDFVDRHPGKRLPLYMALHILGSIAKGLEIIHDTGDYHGDLHTGNILIKQKGIGFRIKLIDPFDWKDAKSANIRKDVVDLIRVFYDMIGGQKHYAKQPPEVKSICCGLKASLINKKFKNAGALRKFLYSFEWQT